MRRARLLPFCLLLLGPPAPAAGAKIHVDYDVTTAFGEYTSFQFLETRWDLRRVAPALHLDVARQIVSHARSGGLAMVPSDPDVYFAYYVAYEAELRLASEDLPYGYGDGFSPGGYWQGGGGTRGAADQSFIFGKGTFVLDVWDRERGVLVWRGMAAGAIRKDLERNRPRLGKALQKLTRRWEEMYGTRAAAPRGPAADRRR